MLYFDEPRGLQLVKTYGDTSFSLKHLLRDLLSNLTFLKTFFSINLKENVGYLYFFHVLSIQQLLQLDNNKPLISLLLFLLFMPMGKPILL